MTATVTTLSVEVNRAATDATVVDYATGKTSRSIKTGPSSTLDLTLKASDGALLLKRDLLDQQIIDVHARKVVRVNDVELDATPANVRPLIDVKLLGTTDPKGQDEALKAAKAIYG